MSDTKQRAQLFAVLRRMEQDTVRMYDAALSRAEGGSDGRLRSLREGHEGHEKAMQELLGACETEGLAVPEDIQSALEEHVSAVRSARDPDEVLQRLLEAERTTAAEYAVAESAHLSGDERTAIDRLHEEQHAYVQDLEALVPSAS